MKIAFIGDTHNNKLAINLALNKIRELSIDIIIHLGDCVSDISYLRESFNGEIYAVAGNCDYSVKYPKEKILDIHGIKIFFTHGDLYGVKNSLSSILYKGEEVGADIILFGHTHISMMDEVNNIILMNPGSIPKPSPWSVTGCVGLIDISDDGEIISKDLYNIPL